MIDFLQIRRAIISVYDKSGLELLVEVLEKFGVEIFSSGGTYTFLSKKFKNVKSLSEITGIVSILDGRVKTLHPLVHASILARKDSQEHLDELKNFGVEPFDLVVVNFYPFENILANEKASQSEIIEHIDIGGPTLVRSAAKNFESVAVVTSIEQYKILIDELEKFSGKVSYELRRNLAAQAFQKIVEYDSAISNYFNSNSVLNISLKLEKDLRYGENPHQKAQLYGEFFNYFEHLHGKELSFNNILDINAATELVFEFDEIACAIIKHNSPCGVALGKTTLDAYQKALSCDPVSAFGGIVAFNRKIDIETAQKLNEIFLEVIIAPDFENEALEILQKKKDRRLIKVRNDFKGKVGLLINSEIKSVIGGLLIQSKDNIIYNQDSLQFVTDLKPTEDELKNLLFAFTVSKYVKSNAIVFARNLMTIGIGGGQTSRVDSVKIAIMKAKEFNHDLNDSVVASDGFFPFPDSVELASKAGAKLFIQPGGSIRDEEVIQFANEQKLKMVLTKIRHFKH
ncbi:MAG: bifunctional phosphoribosylaminoimidazolecarboxamide formyltransferase/IMP cyclohydrolase [Ignavibacteria bacterium]|nr:bifunctional phosphoribosylaminoimidazolecarboxamide formyltransferase/IMP cyclohydrolase [Ignavibacteria bacterium]